MLSEVQFDQTFQGVRHFRGCQGLCSLAAKTPNCTRGEVSVAPCVTYAAARNPYQ